MKKSGKSFFKLLALALVDNPVAGQHVDGQHVLPVSKLYGS